MSSSQTSIVALAPRPITSKEPIALEPRDRLTRKQKLFVEYFLRGNSAHRAALLAGYSPYTAESASSTILKHRLVIQEIRRRADESFEDEKINTDWVIQEAAKLAKANMLDYIDVDDDGTFKVNLKRCTRDMGSAIQELSYDPEGRPKIRLVDKKASVELLARIKKMFNDKDSQDPNSTAMTIQAWDKIVQNITVNQQFNVVEPQERHKILEASK